MKRQLARLPCGILVLFLLLAVTSLAPAQDFLGQWRILKVFTTANLEKDTDNRMLHLVLAGPKTPTRIDGLILPQSMDVDFSINPNNKAQHVTLTNDGTLLMSLNWRTSPEPRENPEEETLRVWSDSEAEYNLYTILYIDPSTLVFSDRSRAGSRFLDIYYLERKE